MKLLTTSLVVILLTTLALAAPSAKLRKGRAFKVKRHLDQRAPRNPHLAMVKVTSRYGFKMPDGVFTQQSVNTTGRASNTKSANTAEFLSPVNIGGQQLLLNFDTGSADFWIFSSKLDSSVTKGHTPFDVSKSSSFKTMDGASWNIKYGDGSTASGVVGTDLVDIGGAKVPNQAIELATSLSGSFVQDTNNNGIIGLAFSRLNTVKPSAQKTFFDNVMPTLEQPLFTVSLKPSNEGVYEFGYIDETQFTGSLATVPVITTNGFWEFETPFFTVGGQRIDTPKTTAIADTGTTLLIVSPSVADAYWAKVSGSKASGNGFTFPCDATLPDLGLSVGGSYTAIIPGNLLNFAQTGTNTCFGALQSNGGSGLQIYGDIIFKSQFVVFNGGDNTLSFAPHA
ncbi:MAG: hypothetical protein M1829_002207 [Trizodia sp. TS-e1964]|nr:MAG: hypothetical protein M1829_002207 [Trizodia sp. TS-e1964]